MHQHFRIGSKDIYVVRDHHHALLPWAMVRRSLDTPPLLLTLDHHTDTCLAFRGHLAKDEKAWEGDIQALLQPLIYNIDYRSDSSVEKAISKLRFDEQIHAATLAGIIDVAFVIQLSESSETTSVEEDAYHEARYGSDPWNEDVPEPEPPFTYVLPENRIFIVPTLCLSDCPRYPHTDECTRPLWDAVLEDSFLGEKLAVAQVMAKFVPIENIERQPYILDIDLDYFHTRKAVAPQNSETIRRLIRNCEAITIALEPECVGNLQMKGENLTSDYLLEAVRALIDTAMR